MCGGVCVCRGLSTILNRMIGGRSHKTLEHIFVSILKSGENPIIKVPVTISKMHPTPPVAHTYET